MTRNSGEPLEFCPGNTPCYGSFSLGLDIPTWVMLAGLAISGVEPRVGTGVVLAGAAMEICPATGSLLCAVIKSTSFGGNIALDVFGNAYMGPQLGVDKSLVPSWGVDVRVGYLPGSSEDQVRGFLSGPGLTGTVGWRGESWDLLGNSAREWTIGTSPLHADISWMFWMANLWD